LPEAIAAAVDCLRALVAGGVPLDAAALVGGLGPAFLAALIALKGIGRWSAEIYLIFALGRPDIWPAGDLGLQLAVMECLGFPDRPKEDYTREWLLHDVAPGREHAAIVHQARGVAGDEQDVPCIDLLRELHAVGLRHHDVGEQEVPRPAERAPIRIRPDTPSCCSSASRALRPIRPTGTSEPLTRSIRARRYAR